MSIKSWISDLRMPTSILSSSRCSINKQQIWTWPWHASSSYSSVVSLYEYHYTILDILACMYTKLNLSYHRIRILGLTTSRCKIIYMDKETIYKFAKHVFSRCILSKLLLFCCNCKTVNVLFCEYILFTNHKTSRLSNFLFSFEYSDSVKTDTIWLNYSSIKCKNPGAWQLHFYTTWLQKKSHYWALILSLFMQ